jgi:NAD(P)H-dependent flavin oxidoreductase YrpB (nitropropane dioxygenase family)
MKVRLTFTLDVDVKTTDPDQAEQLAKVKADAVIIQTMEATGYRMKYRESAFSLAPAIDQYLDDLRNILLQ